MSEPNDEVMSEPNDEVMSKPNGHLACHVKALARYSWPACLGRGWS